MSGIRSRPAGMRKHRGFGLEEMRVNLREALEFHLEGLAMDGEPLPAATTHMVAVPEGGLAEWLEVGLPVAEPVGGWTDWTRPE